MIQVYDYNDEDLVVVNLIDIEDEREYTDLLASMSEEVLTLFQGEYNQLGKIVQEKERNGDYYKYITEHNMTGEEWKRGLIKWYRNLTMSGLKSLK